MALFFFLSAKAALASLPTAYFVALSNPFFFGRPCLLKFFWLKPAPFGNLSVGLCANKSVTSLLRFSLLLYYQAAVVSRTFIFPGNDTADELSRRGTLLVLSAICCSVYTRTSPIHSSLSHIGGVLRHINFLTHRFPRFPLTILYSLVSAATNITCFTLISLELRILHALPVVIRSSNLSSHSALPSYGLFAPLVLWRLSTTSGLGLGEFPGFWGSIVFRHAPVPRKERGNNNNIGLVRYPVRSHIKFIKSSADCHQTFRKRKPQ